MAFASDYYDSAAGQHCLLVEHYGMPGQVLPIQREVPRICGPNIAAVHEAMRRVDLPHRRRALDLGCAVGGSVFALRRYFPRVVGVDRSATLLAQARALQASRQASVTWQAEGCAPQSCFIQLPADAATDGIEFREADVLDLPADLGEFDLVVTEKVPECLPDLPRFLAQLPRLVAPGGYFLHVSSYRWSDQFTPREKQLGTPAQAPAQLDVLLGPAFARRDRFNSTFLLECNAAWFSFGIAEALLWQRI
jgi:SAM-dependent methyltransferase